MTTNASFNFRDVAVLSVDAQLAPEIVTSAQIDQWLAPAYERFGTEGGLLEGLAGISERRWWPRGVSFTDAASMAGREAMTKAGVRPDDIGLLIDTSVCREHLEPSAAVAVHAELGLPASCINFDLANACLGFMNAMWLAGTMIDSGQIDYALIVDGEGSRQPIERTVERLNSPESTIDDLFDQFATLTLGSGSAAAVIGRHSDNPGSHKLVGGVARADTGHHRLCIGDLEGMKTDTKALLNAGLQLSKETWVEAHERGWLDADRYVVHQISAVHTTMMCDLLGLDTAKVPLTFPMFGNIGPASVPITLAGEVDTLSAGDQVLCLGIGSGINASVTEIIW